MNTHANISPDADTPFDPDGARTERHLRLLERLADIGMELAETVAHQAKGQRDLQDVADRAGVKEVIEETIVLEVRGDFGTAFAKITRAVRMTILLEDKLAKDWRLRQAGIAERHRVQRRARREAEQALDAQAAEDRINDRQDAICEAVRDVIRAERPEQVERLEQERLMKSLDRLWGWDPEGDPFARPELYIETGGDEALISQQIAAHCRALGLKPDWGLWKDTVWALEEAEAGAKGSPYAAGTGPPDG